MYIYIEREREVKQDGMGMPLVKTNYFSQLVPAVAILKGYVEFVMKNILRHFTIEVSYFRPYAQTKNNGDERKVCMKWIQFRSCFRPSDAKVSSFIIQKYSSWFSLSFNVSVNVAGMFLSCSLIINFL